MKEALRTNALQYLTIKTLMIRSFMFIIVGANSVPTTLLQTGIEELKRLEVRSAQIKSRSTYRVIYYLSKVFERIRFDFWERGLSIF